MFVSTISASSLVQKVASLVKPQRFAHIERVATLAAEIARANGLDAERAYLAGILHDAARDLEPERLKELAPPLIPMEEQHPLALHGRAARVLAESWGITDPEVLEAIEGHVYGVCPDCWIGMAVYIADVSEPGRGVNADIRQLALGGKLLEAYGRAVDSKVNYLQGKGIVVHPRTLAAHHQLQNEAA
jgi:predicted HD superfamily hydrolase involved in NAD metabolism